MIGRSSKAEKAAQKQLTGLPERLTALSRAVEFAHPRLGSDPIAFDVVMFAEHVVDKANARLKHGTAHTLVALLGATGSGKSSVANAIVGSDIATTGLRRPTTSSTLACVWGDEEANGLLDWLEVSSRHSVLDRGEELDGLVLLDVPDHDSVAVEHRMEMERIAEHADMLLWVTDPEKYGDAAMHRYLKRLGQHGAITAMVLNKIDRLSPAELDLCRSDLGRLLVADGLPKATIVGISATTGRGVPELRQVLSKAVTEKRAVAERLSADIKVAASELQDTLGPASKAQVSDRQAKALADDLVDAAGIDAVTEAVAAGHRRDAGLAVGWPVTRWVGRLRPHPLRRLHLGSGSTGRSDLPGIAGANEARALAAIRRTADTVTADLKEPWPTLVRDAATPDSAELRDKVDTAIAGAVRGSGRDKPRWWSMVATLQLLLALAMVAGLVWLGAIFFVAWFQLPDLPTPEYRSIPIPTALAIGGAVLGILVGFIARLLARAGAKRRARRVQKSASDSVRTVADELILKPMRAELDLRNELSGLLTTAAG